MSDALDEPLSIPPDVEAALRSAYEEVMWLSRRPGVTAGMARAWYAQIRAEPLKRRLRLFSGMVSEKAAAAGPDEPLVREHFRRMHSSVSELVRRHLAGNLNDPDEFVRTVVEVESVHIVLLRENSDVRAAEGDYTVAGIALVSWESLPARRREELWRKVLKGNVANATSFAP